MNPYIEKIRALSLSLVDQKKQKMTEQQKKTFDAAHDEGFGCKKELALKFASAVLQYDFSQHKPYKPGLIIVPIEDIRGYKANLPTCIMIRGHAFKLDDLEHGGDIAENEFGKKVRAATTEEVEKFYSEISKSEKAQEHFAHNMKKYSGIAE